MPTSANQGLVTPATTDSPNGPSQMSALATSLENRLVQRFTSAADRATRRPSPTEGEFHYLADVDTYEVRIGSAYQVVWRPNNIPTMTPIAGTYNSARPIQTVGGYVEGTAASNSAIAVLLTPAGKTVSCLMSAVVTSSFKFGNPGGFANTHSVLEIGACTTSQVVFTFVDMNTGSGVGAVIVGFAWMALIQTST